MSSALAMENMRRLRLRASRASGSRIVNLTKPNFSFAANRFIRWRKKQPKPKPKFVHY